MSAWKANKRNKHWIIDFIPFHSYLVILLLLFPVFLIVPRGEIKFSESENFNIKLFVIVAAIYLYFINYIMITAII